MEKLNYESDALPVTWTELKRILIKIKGEEKQEQGNDTDNEKVNEQDKKFEKKIFLLLKECVFKASIEKNKKSSCPQLNEEEYSRLLNSSSIKNTNTSIVREELAQSRREWFALRRELTWLLNCGLSVIGLAAFVFFVTTFWFEKIEVRGVCALISGLILFFLEVILYIIRSEV